MIIIIKFIDPEPIKLRDIYGEVFGLLSARNVVVHTAQCPTVEHYPDGTARNGYLKLEGGLEFNLDKVASWEVIPGGGEREAKVVSQAEEGPGPDLQYVGDISRLDGRTGLVRDYP